MAEVVIVDSKAGAGALVAEAIRSIILENPRSVLGLATGSSPSPVYDALRPALADVDVSEVRGFALDEYVGLDPRHPQSYRSVLRREVTEPLGLNQDQVATPDGFTQRPDDAAKHYESQIDGAGGIDIQLLGIGSNGHIGFNEPGSSFASLTRIKTLTRRTREDNARFFTTPEDVPTHCITQGLGTILRARHLVLLAFGEHKADAIVNAVEGPVTASCPGSAIQLHPHVTVVIDSEAARALNRTPYYRHALANKPAWQRI